MNENNFWVYLVVMAGITYLIRMFPLVLIKKKIQNKFILSFLHYIPYTVLSVMTIPAIFYSTSNTISAMAGFIIAVILSLFDKGLLQVAALSCIAVYIVELFI